MQKHYAVLMSFYRDLQNSQDMLHKMIVDCPWLATYFNLRRLSELQKDNPDMSITFTMKPLARTTKGF